jgi:peptidoglycan/LPS O-acetylase OafA/YrhL
MNPLDQYRPDIDGLRAVAVLPVVLFHSGVGAFAGGFVGVDVFFVISGFLITRIIWSENQAGHFSILRFYERRARRILPALFVVLAVCVAAGSALMLANQFEQFAHSLISALLFSSNIFFWLESGYFAPVIEFMPLAHTWSLAVEEQFYIGFPIFIVLARWLRWNIKLVFILSITLLFVVSVHLSYTKPSVAFYLLPSRAWELMTGALLAVDAVPEIRKRVLREGAALIGLGLIIAGIFLIDSRVAFPGFAALLPCMGAASIIHCGQRTIVGNLLAIRPIVVIGLVLYSLYLWHWPVFVFLRLNAANVDLSAGEATLGIVLSFVLAWATWRFVERPFRDRVRTSTRSVIGLGFGSAAVLIAAGVFIGQAAGLPGRLTERTALLQSAANDIDPLRMPCQNPFVRGVQSEQCRFGPQKVKVSYAIVGDSHAAAIRPAIEALFEGTGRAGTLWWLGACPPLLGAETVPDPDFHLCRHFREDIIKSLSATEEIHTVVLAGRWVPAATGIAPEIGGSYKTYLRDVDTIAINDDETFRVFSRALKRTISEIQSMGKQVLLIGGVPEPGFDVPIVLALAAHNGAPSNATLDVNAVLAANAVVEDLFEEIDRMDGVDFLPVWDIFCHSDCALMLEGIPLYSDDDHITYRAAREIIGPQLQERVQGKLLTPR